MADVIILEKKQTLQNIHKKLSLDDFGYSGTLREEVTLSLKLPAYLRLREHYPTSLDHTFKNEESGEYIYHGVIYHVEGAGTFILSQAGNVRIVKGEQLKKHIKSLIRKFTSGNFLYLHRNRRFSAAIRRHPSETEKNL